MVAGEAGNPTTPSVGCSQPHVPSLARVRYGKHKRTPVDLGGGQRLDRRDREFSSANNDVDRDKAAYV
ncbi:uncharacterized protein RAG0_07428 [Rhynchosporium agropyri]|uniref:Uncharacterized protein n=1 Tax=Rhynchosporium agropyri TaxID=914238 RepID=A0A1E1KLG3_9HELO|nr:uncharacterized protein RAG0_07428 [Rhynchosporium agropyri]